MPSGFFRVDGLLRGDLWVLRIRGHPRAAAVWVISAVPRPVGGIRASTGIIPDVRRWRGP